MHALLGAPPSTAQDQPVPVVLRELADEFNLSTDLVNMLAAVNVDGQQPNTREDWLFLLLAIRRACRILEPLTAPGVHVEKGDKHAV
jgi:hypothetical protein